MDDKMKKILSQTGSGTEADEKKLMDYLNQNLSAEEQHALETVMNDDEFLNDAVDGLQELEDMKHTSAMVRQLNAGLKKQLTKSTKRKRHFFQDGPWIYFSIVLILLLAVIAYIVIKKFTAS